MDDVTGNRNKMGRSPSRGRYDDKSLNTKILMGLMNVGQLQHEVPRWQQHPAAARYFGIRRGSTPQMWAYHWTGGSKPWPMVSCNGLIAGHQAEPPSLWAEQRARC